MADQVTALEIQGMSCSHCVRAVEEALRSVDGVQVETVKIGSATIRYDGRSEQIDAAIDAIGEAGFDAALRK
jgi:copper chaperone